MHPLFYLLHKQITVKELKVEVGKSERNNNNNKGSTNLYVIMIELISSMILFMSYSSARA